MEGELTLSFRAPELADMLAALQWRASVPEALRTTSPITAAQQERFWRDVLSQPNAPHRYWAVYGADGCVALVGLTDLSWQDGHAELSLIVAPGCARGGVGSACVAWVLGHARDVMRLGTVYAECYESNPALGFWERMLTRHSPSGAVTIPRRRFWGGQYHASRLMWWVL